VAIPDSVWDTQRPAQRDAALPGDAVDIPGGVNYHRQFAVEVWPLTFERPAIPVPLPDFKQP
jgi:hypothetical protein